MLREQETARPLRRGRARSRSRSRSRSARPAEAYAGWWSAYRWVAGEPPEAPSEDEALAVDLGAVVRAIRALDTGGARWDGRSRGGPLATRDGAVRAALAASAGLTDTRAVEAAWVGCLGAETCPADTWLHADLMPGNLLLREGRLAAVIDLESACVGDPAVDLMPAWNLFGPRARAAFRAATDADDGDVGTRSRLGDRASDRRPPVLRRHEPGDGGDGPQDARRRPRLTQKLVSSK